MATKTKRVVIVTDIEAGTLSFHEPVANTDAKGVKWTPGKLIRTVDATRYPPNVQRIAMLTVGFRNKLMDTYADPEADVAACLARMDTQLAAGEWDGAGVAGDRTTMALEAYARVIAKPIEIVKAKIAALRADGREADVTARLEHPQVRAMVARIQQERAAERAKAEKEAAKTAPALLDVD